VRAGCCKPTTGFTFEKLHDVVRANELDYHIISKRKDEYKSYEKLAPPRVTTSDGKIVAGEYKRENLPADAIIGLPVWSGVIAGYSDCAAANSSPDVRVAINRCSSASAPILSESISSKLAAVLLNWASACLSCLAICTSVR